jgi:hypothetical protein
MSDKFAYQAPYSKSRGEGTENVYSWIERLNPTVNVLRVSLIKPLGLRSATSRLI